MRKQIIAANWKMNKTTGEAREFVEKLKHDLGSYDKADVVICPPFTSLFVVKDEISDTNYKLGAQSVFWEDKGAYTGEISCEMLREIGCQYVIIGHSERRQYFYETNETVNKKIKSALGMGLIPIVCIGETLRERESGEAFNILKKQVTEGLSGLNEKLNPRAMVIAYEPVWAIGTGRNATPEQAEEAHAYIRSLIRDHFGEEFSEEVRIQYGGSVNSQNASDILKQVNVDGALVGGASLRSDTFAEVVKASK